MVAAEQGTQLLGPNFLPSMVLALGAALVVGNVLALVRPAQREGDVINRRTRARSVVMMIVGLVCSMWALASIFS
jgi:hypothetical protein